MARNYPVVLELYALLLPSLDFWLLFTTIRYYLASIDIGSALRSAGDFTGIKINIGQSLGPDRNLNDFSVYDSSSIRLLQKPRSEFSSFGVFFAHCACTLRLYLTTAPA